LPKCQAKPPARDTPCKKNPDAHNRKVILVSGQVNQPRKNIGDVIYRIRNATTLASLFRVFDVSLRERRHEAWIRTLRDCKHYNSYSVRPWQRTEKRNVVAWTKNAGAVLLLL